jgi:hypothetical protein
MHKDRCSMSVLYIFTIILHVTHTVHITQAHATFTWTTRIRRLVSTCNPGNSHRIHFCTRPSIDGDIESVIIHWWSRHIYSNCAFTIQVADTDWNLRSCLIDIWEANPRLYWPALVHVVMTFITPSYSSSVAASHERSYFTSVAGWTTIASRLSFLTLNSCPRLYQIQTILHAMFLHRSSLLRKISLSSVKL